MARTTEEILAIMIDEKENRAELAGLTSVSESAIWRLVMFVCASAINLFEQLQDSFLQEVDDAASKAISGTDNWWHAEILKFQFDSELGQQQTVEEVTPGIVEYPSIDESLRIVTRAAIKEQSTRRLLIKAAKGDEPLEALTSTELGALGDYARSIGWVGIPIEIRSVDPDECRVELEVFYSGQFVQENVQFNVAAAIEDYFKSLSVDRVDGVIVLNKLIDSIQAVPGVLDIDTLNMKVSIREGSIPLGEKDVEITRTHETFAGYVIGETTSENTLVDTITFTLG